MKAKISCIGTGAMGGAIMRAVCKKFDAWNVAVTSKNPEHAKAFAEENGCKSFEKNSDAELILKNDHLPCQESLNYQFKPVQTIFYHILSNFPWKHF